ncbi:ABC transporter ATP-binding protein [Chloroflexota bacterium]
MLELRDVSRIFLRGAEDRIVALDGINFDIYERDFVTVIGSNGAGKSTLLNIIAGVYPPERGGKVMINGSDVTAISEHSKATHVGRVWQEPRMGTASNLSIEENLSLALKRGKPRGLRSALSRTRRRLFQEALTPLGLGLEKRLTALAGTLSGGQRQALALVMATISRPAILLLDEHVATLDPVTAEVVLELTNMIMREENMTAMMVTHNMEHALQYGNRMIMMHQGKIVVDITGEQKHKLTLNDLIASFERAAGESFKDDTILLRHK